MIGGGSALRLLLYQVASKRTVEHLPLIAPALVPINPLTGGMNVKDLQQPRQLLRGDPVALILVIAPRPGVILAEFSDQALCAHQIWSGDQAILCTLCKDLLNVLEQHHSFIGIFLLAADLLCYGARRLRPMPASRFGNGNQRTPAIPIAVEEAVRYFRVSVA